MEKYSDRPDVRIVDGGSEVMLDPLTETGREWVEANIREDNGYQPYYPMIICEPRYVGAIIEGMMGDGLEVSE